MPLKQRRKFSTARVGSRVSLSRPRTSWRDRKKSLGKSKHFLLRYLSSPFRMSLTVSSLFFSMSSTPLDSVIYRTLGLLSTISMIIFQVLSMSLKSLLSFCICAAISSVVYMGSRYNQCSWTRCHKERMVWTRPSWCSHCFTSTRKSKYDVYRTWRNASKDRHTPDSDATLTKEFCNRGRGLSAAN
mgnify:CR=1 FL=1